MMGCPLAEHGISERPSALGARREPRDSSTDESKGDLTTLGLARPYGQILPTAARETDLSGGVARGLDVRGHVPGHHAPYPQPSAKPMTCGGRDEALERT